MAQETAIEKREAEDIRAEQMRSGQTFVPTVDIVERGNELLLIGDMPGVSPDGVDIQYENGLLTIQGRVAPRQEPTTRFLMQEYGVGDFYRRFEIGEGIDSTQIAAELHDGVLTVHLPKSREILPRKIAVKAS